jgi:phospho-N-acetylmuramoyl-pentapeptide-transferase
MIYNFLAPYIHTSHIANLFHYITFRIGVAMLFSLIICFLIGPYLIKWLHNLQKYGQPIRTDGPKTHKIKAGTPTMGGIMIIFSVCLSTLLFSDLTNKYIWIVLFVFISLGVLGFIDDYIKVVKNHHKGVSAKKKLLFQFTVCMMACLLLRDNDNLYNSILIFPFFKNLLVDLGWFYIPFAMFVIVGASNAVNLTDGLDGLAIVPIAISAASFTLIIYLVGNSFYANYLQIIYVPNISELTIFCASIIGASIGFLWFNSQPAEIFMGDTGSLSLGGALGIVSVITKHEIVLAIIGGLFVLEALSVIIQVYYFKFSGGKRIFRMAPLHHHFEQLGWSESKVVIRFWIMAIIFALIGLSSLKLR